MCSVSSMAEPGGAYGPLQNNLTTVKSLGISIGSLRFHAPDPQERQKRIGREPVLVLLALEALHDRRDLSVTGRLVEVHKDVGRSEVPVILQDLVFEDQLVSKRVPCQFRDESMVLMQIPTVVGEHDVGGDPHLQLFEEGLDLLAYVREEAVSEVLHHDVLPGGSSQE